MKYLIYAGLLIGLIACGTENKPEGLAPNHSGKGFAVFAEQTALNTYKFTVTSNEEHKGAVFSVYGLDDISQIASFNPATRVRLGHVADGHNAGDTFEVTFNIGDNVFIIYEDSLSGGSFVYSTTKEMVRGQFRN